MTSNPRLFGFFLGLGYLVIYLLFAIWPTGAGHGTYIFFLPLWPYLLGGLYYPFIGLIGADLSSMSAKAAYIGITLMHYCGIFFFYFHTDFAEPEYLLKVWRHSDIAILIPTAIFVAGEVVIWINFIVRVTFSMLSPKADG